MICTRPVGVLRSGNVLDQNDNLKLVKGLVISL